MNKNSSTSNFDAKKFFRSVAFSFLFIYFASFFLYFLFPQAFYWRAWEYFEEIVFSKHYVGPKRWNWYEKGCLSRDFLFSFHEKWKTVVTTDDEGFRSVPLKAETYPILMVGDSQTWGCGLEDKVTLPWKVADKLGIPVYNGARVAFTCDRLIKREIFKKSIILEVVSYHGLNLNSFPEGFKSSDYKSLKRKGSRSFFPKTKLFVRLLFKDPRRYFIPYKLGRFFTLNHFYNSFWKQKKQGAIEEFFNEEELPILVNRIEKRKQDLSALGHPYIFCLIPPKDLICSEEPCQKTLKSVQTLFNALREREISAIDLTLPFYHAQKREALYLATDLHFSAFGTELASSVIAQYLSDKCLE